MSKPNMQDLLASSHISGANAEYVDNLYEIFLREPSAVPQQWQEYFQRLTPTNANSRDVSHADIRDQFYALGKQVKTRVVENPSVAPVDRKQAHVLQLINSYRTHGHHRANLDPLQLTQRKPIPDLDLEFHKLSKSDLDTVFSSESPLTKNGAKLSEIYDALQRTYCDTFAIEYMHISDQEITQWFQQRIESVQSHPTLTADQQKELLKQLTAAEGLETYLGTKYVGQKRFSLEGGDSLIPLLQEFVSRGGDAGVKELVIGMAHRGRLNVLVNVLGKSPQSLFDEFEGRKEASKLSGDVKYHMGFSSNVKTKTGLLHLAVAFNPSHLEIISPVVEGSVRARQRRHNDLAEKNQVLAINIHGDAAFAGQGVVMETFNFSQARGFSTGGTIHIVVNNQIGFTTSNPLDARSTLYCTDIAKVVQAPVIHVNNDDPEAVIFAAQLAFDYRIKFKKDVVIDLVCYRRHGHNEADEPSVTQPVMYQRVREMQTTRKIYADKLIARNVINTTDADGFVTQYRDTLDRGDAIVKIESDNLADTYNASWRPFLNTEWTQEVATGVALEKLQRLAKTLDTLPKSFTPHPIVKRLYAERQQMSAGEIPLNWGYAEMMAFATLVDEGFPIRLSGQDCGRGTFAHRHAVLHDNKTAELYVPLQQLAKQKEDAVIIDSVLSEEAVLAFEYGYAAAEPNALTIWEAQFGDFVNGAQVVIDQFISSGEQKWGRLCGLTMFLPHGYEGQGPEHTSARLERFLQLCAQKNMQVCIPTTPAQIFHMLRRQMLRPYRKPLIVLTPKSLLRHKLVVSSLDELVNGKFQTVIPEIDENITPKLVKRVVICSGKVYFDLLQRRRDKKQNDVAIIRVEQLYPFPKDALRAELAKYTLAKKVVWCQEEPKNQGAWYTSRHNMEVCLAEGQKLSYVGRTLAAAPAVGQFALHVEQQRVLVEKALTV